jgi:hypothetical protein
MAIDPEYEPEQATPTYVQPVPIRQSPTIEPRRPATAPALPELDSIVVRREGPLGWFENQQDRRHLDRLIRYHQKGREARAVEQVGNVVEVQGYKEMVERSQQVVDMLSLTRRGSTVGQVAEHGASTAISRIMTRRETIQEALDNDQLNTFTSG